ncbi:MAG: 50S ribosomal protein L6 [Verrucomicrobia bacterium]|jgi:large subunit ribosomal protein L6|nr:50S ribosomal protein L6 [Verrucomicrobiota bacterium]
MSRIGKSPVVVPERVTVTISGRNLVTTGPKGSLAYQLPPGISAQIEKGHVFLRCDVEGQGTKALHGLSRALVNNMVRGVSEGFSKRLEISGVGFKASVQGGVVNLQLGYSHPIAYEIPDQVKVSVEENTKLLIEGPDRQIVGRVAAELRGFYPPEPYKGKGIRYAGEKIIRKEGKTVQ